MSYTVWLEQLYQLDKWQSRKRRLQKPSNNRLRTALYPVGKRKPWKIFPFIILPRASPGHGQRSETYCESSNFSTLSSFLLTAFRFSWLFVFFFFSVFLWAECSEFLNRCWCSGGCLEDFPWLLLLWWLPPWYSLVPHICWCFVYDHWREASLHDVSRKEGLSSCTQRKRYLHDP